MTSRPDAVVGVVFDGSRWTCEACVFTCLTLWDAIGHAVSHQYGVRLAPLPEPRRRER